MHESLTIVAPADGSIYLYDTTLRPEFQTLPMLTTGAGGALESRVNEKFLARAAGQLRSIFRYDVGAT